MPLFHHKFAGITALGTPWMFGWHSNRPTGDLTSAHANAVTWLNSFWADALGLACPASVGARTITTSQITQSTGQQEQITSTSVTLNGTGVGAPLPTDCSVVVTSRTAVANRRGKGRFFLPPFHAGTLGAAGGRVAAATITDLADALKTAFDVYSGAGSDWHVYSRTDRQLRQVINFDIGDLFDTQRGRQDRVPEVRTARTLNA